MDRLRQSHVEVIRRALQWMPPGLDDQLLGADLFCEDPIFAGVGYDTDPSYRRLAHVMFPYHARDRRMTVVLPHGLPRVDIAIHELGHVLHWHLVERLGGVAHAWRALPQLEPVSQYARTNWWENWAEAFTQWVAYDPRVVEETALGRAYWPLGYSLANASKLANLLLTRK